MLIIPAFQEAVEASTGNIVKLCLKKIKQARHWWLMSIILDIQKAKIRRIMVRSQLEQIVQEALS
jgi:hypothetical protein